MNRRNFLKTITILPIVPATMCSAKTPQKLTSHKISLLNHNNIKINGTFKEWVSSIAEEVERLLAIKVAKIGECEPRCVVWVRPHYWDHNKKIPARTIIIASGNMQSSFSFAKEEFDKNRNYPKYLRNLVDVRFTDFRWCLYNLLEKNLIFLRKLNIHYETITIN